MPRWLVDAMPYRRRVATVEGVKLHFVDAGQGPAVVLLHGNPTWSFLWRDVIRELLPYGLRVIAPDLMGFGLSDKPTRVAAHSVTRHIRLITRLVKGLVGDAPVVMVGQDWGGPIAAGVGSHLGDQLAGLVFGNTAVLPPRRPLRPTLFHRFSHLPLVSDLAFRGMNFPLQALPLTQGDPRSIAGLETFAYTWPLLLPWRRTGPLALARMVPDRDGHPSLDELDRIGDAPSGATATPSRRPPSSRPPLATSSRKRSPPCSPSSSARSNPLRPSAPRRFDRHTSGQHRRDPLKPRRRA
jgi:haloalkane dehalogenase